MDYYSICKYRYTIHMITCVVWLKLKFGFLLLDARAGLATTRSRFCDTLKISKMFAPQCFIVQ